MNTWPCLVPLSFFASLLHLTYSQFSMANAISLEASDRSDESDGSDREWCETLRVPAPAALNSPDARSILRWDDKEGVKMSANDISRRVFLVSSAAGAAAMTGTGGVSAQEKAGVEKKGSQRLSVEKLRAWEKLQYGMFIHYGMSTFVQNELPDGMAPATTYAPDKLDVAQWASVARDAGMKYAVLTTKHVAGHCLWPTKHTDYSVANSADKTDVVEKFVTACRDKGVLPGFYYCSWDNHNRFGSKTPSDKGGDLPAFTTSLYQAFQTAQLTDRRDMD
jgi:hypothetical protein